MQRLKYIFVGQNNPLILNPFLEEVLYPPKIFVFAALRKISTLEKYYALFTFPLEYKKWHFKLTCDFIAHVDLYWYEECISAAYIMLLNGDFLLILLMWVGVEGGV